MDGIDSTFLKSIKGIRIKRIAKADTEWIKMYSDFNTLGELNNTVKGEVW